jgi:hypothetical protein
VPQYLHVQQQRIMTSDILWVERCVAAVVYTSQQRDLPVFYHRVSSPNASAVHTAKSAGHCCDWQLSLVACAVHTEQSLGGSPVHAAALACSASAVTAAAAACSSEAKI